MSEEHFTHTAKQFWYIPQEVDNTYASFGDQYETSLSPITAVPVHQFMFRLTERQVREIGPNFEAWVKERVGSYYEVTEMHVEQSYHDFSSLVTVRAIPARTAIPWYPPESKV